MRPVTSPVPSSMSTAVIRRKAPRASRQARGFPRFYEESNLKNGRFSIATFAGDGIGHEIMPACLRVLEVLQRRVGGFELEHQHLAGGAELYRDQGTDITDEAFE